jgi:hypothetical protein
MLIKTPKGWELPEGKATPETIYQDRRAILRGMAACIRSRETTVIRSAGR